MSAASEESFLDALALHVMHHKATLRRPEVSVDAANVTRHQEHSFEQCQAKEALGEPEGPNILKTSQFS